MGRAAAAISLFFPSNIYFRGGVVQDIGQSKHKEVNIYAHYAQMLNGKTNIVDNIQS